MFIAGVAAGTSYIQATGSNLTVSTVISGGQGAGCTTPPPPGWAYEVPISRMFAAHATNPATGLTLLFGGQTFNVATTLGDTWEYQAGCWTLVSGESGWTPCGYHAPSTTYDVATGCTGGGYTYEPEPRFGASMVWDPTLGVFLMFGGCASVASSSYVDTCANAGGANSGYNIFSDTWAFTPGTSFGQGSWSLVTSATCNSAYAYPYAQYDAEVVTTFQSPGYTCQYVVGTGTTLNSYCDTSTYIGCYFYGVYGASMVYDPDPTQCAQGGANPCVLLYGGAYQFSEYQTTDFGPCVTDYAVADDGNYCSDELWELSGSSLTSLKWIEEQYYVTFDTFDAGQADPWGHYSDCWVTTTTVGSPAKTSCLGSATVTVPTVLNTGDGLAYPSLLAPGCTSSACTLIITGGEYATNAASGEVCTSGTWYLTGSVNGTSGTWTKVTTTNFPTTAGAIEIYDQVPSGTDATLSNKVVFFDGASPTGSGTYPAVATTIWYESPSPGSAWASWSSETLSPDDLFGGAGWYDPGVNAAIAFGGWDRTVNEPGSEYTLV